MSRARRGSVRSASLGLFGVDLGSTDITFRPVNGTVHDSGLMIVHWLVVVERRTWQQHAAAEAAELAFH